MKQSKKNAFTLIELVEVLVIMAIIALIVSPLVMNIIRKARTASDKRSVDAYGRSIELAIAGYLLDTGKFPTEASQLTIEYSGNQVECTTTQINPDSSVYLSNCKVNNREVSNYTYGSDKTPSYTIYSVGNQVTYNNVNYYVIKDSGAKESTVTLLKAEPLTVAEVNEYGKTGTTANHVNKYTSVSRETAGDVNGFGAITYYSSETCGYINNQWIDTGCKNDYSSSDVKYVVDAWTEQNVQNGLIEARLITEEEYKLIRELYNWSYSSNYCYWTSTPYVKDSVFVVRDGGDYSSEVIFDILGARGTPQKSAVVRPVIVLHKSVLQ